MNGTMEANKLTTATTAVRTFNILVPLADYRPMRNWLAVGYVSCDLVDASSDGVKPTKLTVRIR